MVDKLDPKDAVGTLGNELQHELLKMANVYRQKLHCLAMELHEDYKAMLDVPAPTPPAISRSKTKKTTYVRFAVFKAPDGAIHLTIPRGAEYEGLEDAHIRIVDDPTKSVGHPRLHKVLSQVLVTPLDDEQAA